MPPEPEIKEQNFYLEYLEEKKRIEEQQAQNQNQNQQPNPAPISVGVAGTPEPMADRQVFALSLTPTQPLPSQPFTPSLPNPGMIPIKPVSQAKEPRSSIHVQPAHPAESNGFGNQIQPLGSQIQSQTMVHRQLGGGMMLTNPQADKVAPRSQIYQSAHNLADPKDLEIAEEAPPQKMFSGPVLQVKRSFFVGQ